MKIKRFPRVLRSPRLFPRGTKSDLGRGVCICGELGRFYVVRHDIKTKYAYGQEFCSKKCEEFLDKLEAAWLAVQKSGN